MFRIMSEVVTGLSSIALFLFAYAFAPWTQNLIGGAEIAGVPIWIVCLALALGLVAATVHLVRTGPGHAISEGR